MGRRFWTLWASFSASNLGDGLSLVAFPLLAVNLTDDARLVAAVAAARFLPFLVVGLPAGVLIDRFDRRRIAMIAQLVRSVVLIGLVLAIFGDAASIALLAGGGFVVGVAEVMTPRTVVVGFPESTGANELVDAEHPFSRYPVYTDDLDHITGYVLLSDALARVADDEHSAPLDSMRRDLVVVPEEDSLLEVFEALIEKKEHIALVVDEYGGTSGIVTMEDVIETLLGLEITDETDMNTDMQALARERWQQRASKLGLDAERDAQIRFGLTGRSEVPRPNSE